MHRGEEEQVTVNSYIFQSPYSQSFQVGRPDPAMLKAREEEIRKEQQPEPLEESSPYQQAPALKSAVAYAASEGFSVSSNQVEQFVNASFVKNQNAYVKVYAES